MRTRADGKPDGRCRPDRKPNSKKPPNRVLNLPPAETEYDEIRRQKLTRLGWEIKVTEGAHHDR